MTKWFLNIDIKKEIQDLKKFCEDFSEDYIFEDEIEQKYMDLVKNLKTKFSEYESDIKRITDDDGTWESIENELEDMIVASDVECSNYCMENIYQYCDVAGIYLIQI